MVVDAEASRGMLYSAEMVSVFDILFKYSPESTLYLTFSYLIWL